MSLASRFMAACGETMMANPMKPTSAMAKPSSIPVRKRTRSDARPKSPTSTSLIERPSVDFNQIADHDQTLDETADADPVGDGVERKLEGKRNLSRSVEISRILEQVPTG